MFLSSASRSSGTLRHPEGHQVVRAGAASAQQAAAGGISLTAYLTRAPLRQTLSPKKMERPRRDTALPLLGGSVG